MERLSNAYLAEGLRRLADNVRQIEFCRSESTSACEKANAPPDYEALKEVPEYVAWQAFRSDIIAELRAAVDLASKHCGAELENCLKLAISVENGYLPSLPALVVDAVVELELIHAALKQPSESAALATADMVKLLTWKGSRCTAKQFQRLAGVADHGKYKLPGFPKPTSHHEAPNKNGRIYYWDKNAVVKFFEESPEGGLNARHARH